MSDVDILAIGPHPDDVEIGVGGLLAKSADAGMAVAILDLTQGEMGSRGTPQERADEAQAAATVLGASQRDNARLPDGGIANTTDQRLAVIKHIRSVRPRIILAPMADDRHPDHEAAHYIVRDSVYLAGLRKIDTGQEAFRPAMTYYFRVYGDPSPPTLLVDISDVWDRKENALKAYKSQFYNPAYDGAETFVSSQAFWEGIRARAQYWGQQAGTAYAEPLYSLGPLAVDVPPGWN